MVYEQVKDEKFVDDEEETNNNKEGKNEGSQELNENESLEDIDK